MQIKQQNLPIGYWIKKADERLTTSINKIHKSAHLTRLGWQLLHTIHEQETIKISKLIDIVSPFASDKEVKEELNNFVTEGFIILEEDVKLTATGKEIYLQCFEKQKVVR